MQILTYGLIFLSKVIENALATLRIIVVANGKKLFGAILQGVVGIVWVVSAGIVITNIKEDPLKAVFFALGSTVGSYVGSIIEEKLALGTCMLTAVVQEKNYKFITRTLRNQGYQLIVVDGRQTKGDLKLIMIIVKRKNSFRLSRIIRGLDQQAIIISESIKPVLTALP